MIEQIPLLAVPNLPKEIQAVYSGDGDESLHDIRQRIQDLEAEKKAKLAEIQSSLNALEKLRVRVEKIKSLRDFSVRNYNHVVSLLNTYFLNVYFDKINRKIKLEPYSKPEEMVLHDSELELDKVVIKFCTKNGEQWHLVIVNGLCSLEPNSHENDIFCRLIPPGMRIDQATDVELIEIIESRENMRSKLGNALNNKGPVLKITNGEGVDLKLSLFFK